MSMMKDLFIDDMTQVIRYIKDYNDIDTVLLEWSGDNVADYGYTAEDVLDNYDVDRDLFDLTVDCIEENVKGEYINNDFIGYAQEIYKAIRDELIELINSIMELHLAY